MTYSPTRVDDKSYEHALRHYQSENRNICLAWIDTGMCPLNMMHLNCPFQHVYPITMSKNNILRHKRLITLKKDLFQNVDKGK